MGGITYAHVEQDYLLDSHTFLWAVKMPGRLGAEALRIIESLDNRIYLSSISAYEIARKLRLGKLDATYASIAERMGESSKQLGATELPLSLAEADFAGKLNWEHRDPFDRLLAAQAILNNLTLLSDDAALKTFNQVATKW